MKVLDFIRSNKDWESILQATPYNITIKRDSPYFLLKYNQFGSDFTNPIVRECRGCIFKDYGDGEIKLVCYPFNKFGNYGESYADEIDWRTASVQEKVDGSLIKLFYDDGGWHVATNGTIDAFKAFVGDTGITFGDLFEQACGRHDVIFDENYTWMFELVSPLSRVVIHYQETKLYFLGARNNITEKEYSPEAMNVDVDFLKSHNIEIPKRYKINTLEDCIEAAKHMSKNEEGFVVCDKNFHRIKVKSPEYLIAAKLKNNGVITVSRVVDMWKENKLDDFLAYCPEYKQFAIGIVNKLINMMTSIWNEWWNVHKYADCDRKKFAEVIIDCEYKDCLFQKYMNHNLLLTEYMQKQSTKTIVKMMNTYDAIECEKQLLERFDEPYKSLGKGVCRSCSGVKDCEMPCGYLQAKANYCE